MQQSLPIIINGAGLAGSLMAIYLAKRGMPVKVFEKRPDMRKSTIAAGRSINLALSNRGINALKRVGIEQEILKDAIPMFGRMLHSPTGELKQAPYGKDQTEYINSISRGGLNKALITLAAQQPNVEFFFDQECLEADFEKNTVILKHNITGEETRIQGQVIIGADGANSAIRRSLERRKAYTFYTKWLDHGYKELTIPAGENGTFLIEKNALHIWPRGSYMLIALPNTDGTFTCTLFLPMTGELSFESLKEDTTILDFFKTQFPDTLPLIPNLVEEFKNNPVGKLGTLKGFPWHLDDKAVLIGDAAHAIVPFYGQGMNASFEDCIVLDECIEQFGMDWKKVFEAYENSRKLNADAIADLAIENFYEMRDHVANPVFRKKRELEHQLENQFSDYHSKYSLVTFHPEVPYKIAKEKGNKQDTFLMDFCSQLEDTTTVDLSTLYEQLKAL